jgi:hypothetical protein
MERYKRDEIGTTDRRWLCARQGNRWTAKATWFEEDNKDASKAPEEISERNKQEQNQTIRSRPGDDSRVPISP